MKEPNNLSSDSSPAVTLTVGQLRQLIRDEIQAGLQRDDQGGSLLTPDDLATRLNVPVSWVYEQSRVGNVPTARVGRYLRFRLSEVLEHLNRD